MITNKILQFCEKLSDDATVSQRKIINDAFFVAPFDKEGNSMQFEKTANAFIASKKPISVQSNSPKLESDSLPNIYPLASNISIEKQQIYRKRNVYRKFFFLI